MTSVRGHLTSQDFGEQYKRWTSCNPLELFSAPILTTVSEDAKNIAKNLHACARQADLLMIWTDCDREGEHIGSEIVSICRKAKASLPIRRAKFSAIIASQIHQAMTHPVELDWKAVAAVESRIELDLRLGAAFTRLQSLKLQQHFDELRTRVVSYGPCQFPTLGFVVEQYYKVMDFVPEPFWYIAVMKKRNNINVDFKWSRNHLFVEQEVAAIYERCVANPEATVTKVTTKQTRKFKPQPLTTVELQKAGGRLLRMAPKRVLDIAEKLYQRGILSYPRTETDQYDPAFDFRTYIEKQKGHPDWGPFATGLNDESRNAFEKPVNGSKNDKAHPPIHPTKPAIDLTGDEKRVYEFVTRRFLASCSKHAIGKQTTVDLDIAAEKFSVNGVVVVEHNYLNVYPYDSWGGPALPEFRENERFRPSKIDKKEGETTRPKLLTEADLVSLMDRNGIGTDATIAEHIDKIIKRDYVMVQPEGQVKYLVPSTLGMGLVEGYNSIERLQDERSLCKPQLRRQTEERMALICDGVRTKEETLAESLQEYQAVFEKVDVHMHKLITSMTRYLRGAVAGEEADEAALVDDYNDDGQPPPPAPDSDRANARLRVQSHTIDARRDTTRPDDNVIIDLSDDDDENFAEIVGQAHRLSSIIGHEPQSTTGEEPQLQTVLTSVPPVGQPVVHTSVQCRCGVDAQMRTVQSEGRNNGRSYWGCFKPQSEGCGFFQWVGEEPAPANEHFTDRSRASARVEDVRRCGCELEAKKLVVSKSGANQGRTFWMCPNISKLAQCNFFEWDDVPPRQLQQQQQQQQNREIASTRGGENGQACFTCGASGHWSNACPRNGNGDGNAADSPRRRGAFARDLQGTENGRGKRAGSRGAAKSALNGDKGGRSGSCYRCGGQGHWASECTDETGMRSGGGGAKGRGRGGGFGGGKRRKM